MAAVIAPGLEVCTHRGRVGVMANASPWQWVTPGKAREMAELLNAAADEAERKRV